MHDKKERREDCTIFNRTTFPPTKVIFISGSRQSFLDPPPSSSFSARAKGDEDTVLM